MGMRCVWHILSPLKFPFFSLLTFLPMDCHYSIIATQRYQNRAWDAPDTSQAPEIFFFVSLFFITPFYLEPTWDCHLKHDQAKNVPRVVKIDVSWAVGFFVFPILLTIFTHLCLLGHTLKYVIYFDHFWLCFILLSFIFVLFVLLATFGYSSHGFSR